MFIPSHLAQHNGLADEIWKMGSFVWEAWASPGISSRGNSHSCHGCKVSPSRFFSSIISRWTCLLARSCLVTGLVWSFLGHTGEKRSLACWELLFASCGQHTRQHWLDVPWERNRTNVEVVDSGRLLLYSASWILTVPFRGSIGWI